MIDIKNKILESLREYDPTLDIRSGSVINDILVGPLTLLLNVYEREVLSILDKFSFTDVTTASTEEMDALANFYLLERKTGTKAEGEIWFYLNYPTSISIQAGNLFNVMDTDLYFEVTQDFYLSKLDIIDYYDNGYYVVGPVKVVATDYGNKYSLLENTLFEVPFTYTESVAKISNKEDFSYAENLESNEQLFNRLKTTLYGSSLTSPTNIKNIILNENPYISAVEVIGAGSPYMWRDLIENTSNPDAYNKENFYLAKSGLHDTHYDVPHSVWSLNASDVVNGNEVEFPELGQWVSEISDDGYKGLYLKDDPSYLETKEEILVYDFYSNIGNTHQSLIEHNFKNGGQWKFNDASNTSFSLKNLEEISVEGDQLVLGYQVIDEPPIPSTLPLEIRQGLANKTLTAEDLLNWIVANSGLETIHNYYPLIHRKLDKSSNIGIEFSFVTGDNTEEGRICYATTRRHNTQLYVHDGFGLAFKKQPQYLIRLQANNYGQNLTQRTADLQKLKDENGLSSLSEAATYLGHIKENKQFLKHNVFLVDNNALTEDIFVNYETLIETSTGINQFVQASKVWIEPGIEYFVKYFIYEGFGFKAWISETKNSFEESNKVLYKGQSYPNYLPVTGSEIYDAVSGEFEEDVNRKSFGISILNTRNYEWKFKDLKIYSIVNTIPMHLFKFYIDPTKYNTVGSLEIDYFGAAFDDTLMLPEYEGVSRSKVKFGVYNKNNSWESLGEHTYDLGPQIYSGITLNMDNLKISSILNDPRDNYLINDYLYLAATAANVGEQFSLNKAHTLRSYYIEVRNGNPPEEHRGNCVDIYCFDPNSYKIKTFLVNITSTEVLLNNIDGYILDILSIKEFFGDLELDSDIVSFVNTNKGETYGNDNSYKLILADQSLIGGIIEITYLYWSKGNYTNNLIVNSENRFPSADYKVKAMPISLVKINELKYSGGLDEEEMKLKIIEHINSNLTSLDKSDLVDLLYNNGATFVDLNMDIEIVEFDLFLNKTYKIFSNQTYTVPNSNLARLYTNSENIIQLIKQ